MEVPDSAVEWVRGTVQGKLDDLNKQKDIAMINYMVTVCMMPALEVDTYVIYAHFFLMQFEIYHCLAVYWIEELWSKISNLKQKGNTHRNEVTLNHALFYKRSNQPNRHVSM